MSLGYKSSSIIGGPLDNTVTAQLKVRKDIVKKSSSRDEKELLYLNSTTGWVKMTSSVDVETTKGGYSSYNARNRVLLGGTVANNKQKGGIFNQEDTAYSKSNLLGYRPMAGITSFRVDTKNNFGTLRIASVDFKVNSVEELDELEELFLRPGFSVLLEWGHSLYYNNSNRFVNTVDTFPQSFFTGLSGEKIEKEIKSLKTKSGGNYDGMYGIIKNFVWSYNLDGGYDCKVDIVSKGELIESLSMAISPNANDKLKITTAFYNEKENATALHAILNIIKYAETRKYYQGALTEDDNITTNSITEALEQNAPILSKELISELNKVGRKLHVITAQLEGDIATDTEQWSRYIPFSVLLQLLNQIFVLNNEYGDVVDFFIGSSTNTVNTPFLTFDQHFGLDPQICILPKPKTSILSGNTRKLHYSVSEQAEVPSNSSEDDILNIYINTDFILNCANKAINSENLNADSVYDFLKDILTGIQKNLGNINDFDIHFEEEESKHYIVDRTVTSNDDDVKGSFIDLVGLNTTVENLTFASKLSNNITTIMAVAAQVGKSDVGKDMLAMQTWQQGLQDRHNVRKDVGSSKQEQGNNKVKEPEEQKDFERLTTFISKLNSGNIEVLNYNYEDINGLETSFKLLMVKLLEYYSVKKNTNPAGLIPFELSFTIKGISGMKIGQAFKVEDSILPKRYRKSVGFLVTGVSHSIQGNRWVTDIKTQMIITRKLSDEVLKYDFNKSLQNFTESL